MEGIIERAKKAYNDNTAGHKSQIVSLQKEIEHLDMQIAGVVRKTCDWSQKEVDELIKPEIKKTLESRGIEVIALPTKQAWKTYNALRETRNTVGAFHLTC